MDFLDEHRIVTGLQGSDPKVIIVQLAEQLYATSKVAVSKEEFIQLVMDRNDQMTTCVGEGLMIPHAILESGAEVKGVLGISAEGLPFKTPDDRPVHAVLLLATPASDRRRHLEVLSAFATAITRDVNMREQLYHARSPAHAYDIIHADEAADINYFLEEAMESLSEQKE